MNNSKSIIRKALEKGADPMNKYNFPLHQHIEELTGQVSDREASDTGIEMEINNNEQ